MLRKHNGLYYTQVSTITVDSSTSNTTLAVPPDISIYYHTPDGVEDDDVSLDLI